MHRRTWNAASSLSCSTSLRVADNARRSNTADPRRTSGVVAFQSHTCGRRLSFSMQKECVVNSGNKQQFCCLAHLQHNPVAILEPVASLLFALLCEFAYCPVAAHFQEQRMAPIRVKCLFSHDCLSCCVVTVKLDLNIGVRHSCIILLKYAMCLGIVRLS